MLCVCVYSSLLQIVKTGPMSVADPELKTYVTVHLPTVLSTFFDSSQIPGLLKIQVRIIYLYVHAVYLYLLYIAWADQRHRQCCIRHTEQILNGTVLYDGRQGEGGRTFAFPRFGELTSA